uniref:Uncharacterized protein n=1 Tax=Anguilla anguilla TaxID=7936 RepID=A0A0E9TQR0_ANGAN
MQSFIKHANHRCLSEKTQKWKGKPDCKLANYDSTFRKKQDLHKIMKKTLINHSQH